MWKIRIRISSLLLIVSRLCLARLCRLKLSLSSQRSKSQESQKLHPEPIMQSKSYKHQNPQQVCPLYQAKICNRRHRILNHLSHHYLQKLCKLKHKASNHRHSPQPPIPTKTLQSQAQNLKPSAPSQPPLPSKALQNEAQNLKRSSDKGNLLAPSIGISGISSAQKSPETPTILGQPQNLPSLQQSTQGQKSYPLH